MRVMEGQAVITENPGFRFPAPVRILAYFISVVFHPLFIPLYVTWFLMTTHPIQFADFSGRVRLAILGPVIENTLILPLAVVLLCKPLGFISSLQMKTQRDRIVPYVATMIFYYWIYRVSVYHSGNHESFPPMLCIFLLGNFIAIILAFLANIGLKLSMHSLAMGGVIGVMIQLLNDPYFNPSVPLLITICLAGLVASSRLVLSAHRSREIYWGFMIGILSQMVAIFLF